MNRVTGKLELVGRALEPIFHGSGSIGNTQCLRTQRIYSETVSKVVKLPFISGNSLKHLIRVGAAKFAIKAMGIEDGSLSKPVVHLLFSGGALGKKGSTVRLDKARELEELFPVLSLCGYSAANVMPPAKIRTDHIHLVCLENSFRLPSNLLDKEEATMRANEFREEEFGTRHEVTRVDNMARRLLPPEQLDKETKLLSAAADKMNSNEPREKQEGSGQMIYDFEVVIPGSLWWSTLSFYDLSAFEIAALQSAFIQEAQGLSGDGGTIFSLGGKSAVGFGKISFKMLGLLAQPTGPKYKPSSKLVFGKIDPKATLDKYGNHLLDNKKRILEILEAVA